MKKLMSSWLAMLLAAVLCAGFVSCKDDDDDGDKGTSKGTIVGNWQFEDLEGGGYAFELYSFYADGTYECDWQEGSYSSGTLSSGNDGGEYTLSSGILTLDCQYSTNNGTGVRKYNCKIEGDKMYWTRSNGSDRVLHKVDYDELPGDY